MAANGGEAGEPELLPAERARETALEATARGGPPVRQPRPTEPEEPHLSPPDPFKHPSGELRAPEMAFRLGVLLGAGLFLMEGMGAPWQFSGFTIAAAAIPAVLVTLTLVLQWRVLGDWRRHTQRLIHLMFALVLLVPITALLNPDLGATALPDGLENPLASLTRTFSNVPGLNIALSGLTVLALTVVYLVVLGTLILAKGVGQRGAMATLAAALAGFSLFLAPTAETLVGLTLLAFFLRAQWERPLLVPDRLLQYLSPMQLDFLRELVKEGALSPGETKLYMEEDAAAFGQLVELGLVDYDRMVREVTPGRRLLHDPACETFETALSFVRRVVWMALGLMYFLLPDLIPGPLDDIVVMTIASGAATGWFQDLLGSRRRRRRPY